MSDREQRIRDRAHALWEQEGRPEGRHNEHWERASREIDYEFGQPDPGRLSNQQEIPAASVGSASGLQPSGTSPGGGPGAGMGSIGTGGGSTGGAATGSVAQSRRSARTRP